MEPSIDPAQYGNQKGISIQHYLVNMVNRILTILDTNNQKEKYAVIAKLVDWSKAFDMQDPALGVKSFIKMESDRVLYLYSSTTSKTERWLSSGRVCSPAPGTCLVGVPRGLQWD